MIPQADSRVKVKPPRLIRLLAWLLIAYGVLAIFGGIIDKDHTGDQGLGC